MRTRILKTLSVCAVLLFCAASFAFAAVECNFDPTDYGWDINNPEVWANKVATIEITCTENGLPVSDHTAEFTLTLNKGPIDNPGWPPKIPQSWPLENPPSIKSR